MAGAGGELLSLELIAEQRIDAAYAARTHGELVVLARGMLVRR